MSTTLHYQILGRLWMPQCKAATHGTQRVGKGPFQRDIDVTDISEVSDFIYTQAGDFSSVIDWTASYTTQERNGNVTTTTEHIVKEWSNEDNELDYYDCYADDSDA